MFSCPLHNWFSPDFPCPACQKQMTSTTDVVINAEGTSATFPNPDDEIKELKTQLQQGIERQRELEEALRWIIEIAEPRQYNKLIVAKAQQLLNP